ncbi:hypothetical protein BAE44_0000213 [Dichanthelium oligosanthes]|uniref:Uncharacterized protein n=1 Tax=Dichanthelium oligosanthes TaxID=888268 RepID=A0A1E5WN27_9POAL|nr:hypothetical protein BAE44_0000213 [Dichanthelium oligosanthes]
MTDSNKGWHSECFYVANPPLPLPKFSGRFAQKSNEWEWATDKDERKTWTGPMLALLRELKASGLTGVRVLWTFFERRVQPLAARERPLFRYTGADDPMRTSPEPLTLGEVRSRVGAVIKRAKNTEDDLTELDRHEAGLALEPVARDEGHDPAVPLRSRTYYPPLQEGEDRRAANRAENERLRALSQEKKKRKAKKARKQMQQAWQGSLLEEEEVTDDDDDEGGDDDGDDEDDDDNDVEARYEEVLGLGKRPAEGELGGPSSKRVHDGDPGQGSSRATPSVGHVPGHSGEAQTSAGEAPQSVVPAPTADVGLAQSNLGTDSRETVVAQPTVPPTPIAALATPSPACAGAGSLARARPWERFLLCTSSPLLRAAPTAVFGTGSSATTAAAGSTTTAVAGASAGLEEAPDAGAAPYSEPQREEIPLGGAAVGETEVLDLTGDASEEEDMAIMLEAVMEE